MSNVMRNDLTIEGENVRRVLDAIGFNPEGDLIDFDRIVPRPTEKPKEGWEKWVADNWGTMPYDRARDGDIFELTESKAYFRLYTKWTSAFPLIETLAKRFPGFSFHLWNWEQTNHLWGEATWENGRCTLLVPIFAMKLNDDGFPANDLVTNDMRTAAAQLVSGAVERCNGCTPHTRDAERIVAELIAASGHSVKVGFEPNDDGSWYLYVDAEAKATSAKETAS